MRQASSRGIRSFRLRGSEADRRVALAALSLSLAAGMLGLVAGLWEFAGDLGRAALAVLAFAFAVCGIWNVLQAIGVFGEWLLSRRQQSRRAEGSCARCGYDMAAVKGNHCPECGFVDLQPRVPARGARQASSPR